MGNFKSNSRSGGFNKNRSGGNSGGFNRGRGGFRDRDSGGFERRPEMHKVTCSKCGKQCEVPFRPTGDKPVFCSDCFRTEGNSGSRPRNNFDSKNKNTSSQSGISSEQFAQLNKKLDKILLVLQELEIAPDEEDLEDEEENDEDDSEEDK